MAEDVRDLLDSPTNPVKVIRVKCRDCTNNQPVEIDNCTVTRCPLHAWRMGKNPYRKKVVETEEQKRKRAANLRSTRSLV